MPAIGAKDPSKILIFSLPSQGRYEIKWYKDLVKWCVALESNIQGFFLTMLIVLRIESYLIVQWLQKKKYQDHLDFLQRLGCVTFW